MNNTLEQEFLSEKNTFTLFNMFQKSVKAKLQINVGKEYFDKMIEIMEELCDIEVESLQKVNKMVLQKILNYLNNNANIRNMQEQPVELSSVQNERMSLINKRPHASYIPREETKIPQNNNPAIIGRVNKINNPTDRNIPGTMNEFEQMLSQRNDNVPINQVGSLNNKQTLTLPDRKMPQFEKRNDDSTLKVPERQMPSLSGANLNQNNHSTLKVPERQMPSLSGANLNQNNHSTLKVPERQMPSLSGANLNQNNHSTLKVPERQMPSLSGTNLSKNNHSTLKVPERQMPSVISKPTEFDQQMKLPERKIPTINNFNQKAIKPQQGTYPPQQGAFPPQQSTYPPQQGAFPPQQGAFPPQQGTYPPQQGAFPPQQGAFPPQQGTYPPQQGAFPPQQGTYPPQQGAFPPQQGAFPPQQGAFPPQQGAFPPQQGAFPPKNNKLSNDNPIKISERKMPVLIQTNKEEKKKHLENSVKNAEEKIANIMNTRKKNISEKQYVLIDSRKRNMELYPDCNAYIYKLPKEYKSISSIHLISGRIPEVNYNCIGIDIIILGDDKINIKIDPGTYQLDELLDEISKRLPTCEVSGLKNNKIMIRNLDDENLDIETEIEFERIDAHTVIFKPFIEQDSYLELHINNLKLKTRISDRPSCIAQLYYPSETNVIHIAPKIKLAELTNLDQLEISFKRWNGELVNFYDNQHLLTFQFE